MKQVKISEFKIDNCIAYMIQQITGDTTQEILGYFHSIAMFVGDDIAKKSRARWVTKDIILFYKETPIPYRLVIHGGSPREIVDMRVDVCFPKKPLTQDVTGLIDRILEVDFGLSDDDNMSKFVKPELKSPRCLKPVREKQNEQRK